MAISHRLPETVAVPGAVSFHDHLREPSPVNKSEDFESGSLAALHGGFVACNDMPNTPERPTTTVQRVAEKHKRIEDKAHLPIGIAGGVDVESGNTSQIEQMDPMVTIWKFYDDVTTGNERSYGAAAFEPFVKKIHEVNPQKVIALHASAEGVQDFIDLVADKYSHPLVIVHMTNPADVKLVARAKARGLPVYGGVTYADLILNQDDVKNMGWFGRKKPPFPPAVDSEQLLYQLVHGALDYVETDHAPHSVESKSEADEDNPEGLDDPERKKPYGVPSLEFANKLLLRLCALGKLSVEKTFDDSIKRFIQITSEVPAYLLGVAVSSTTKVIYKMEESEITKDNVVSRADWTPFEGRKAIGRVVLVRTAHNTLMRNGEILDRPAIPVLKRGQLV